MSDFRVVVPTDEFEAEVEWTGERCRWSASEREFGLGPSSTWIGNQGLAQSHLDALRKFFFVTRLSSEVLHRTSPGELVLAHHGDSEVARIFAMPCTKPDCGEHWYVARLDGESDTWRLFGRDCEYSWYRGVPFSADLCREIGEPSWGSKLLNE